MKDFTFELYTVGQEGKVFRGRFSTTARTLEEAQSDFRIWIRRSEKELRIPDTLDGWGYTCQVNFR